MIESCRACSPRNKWISFGFHWFLDAFKKFRDFNDVLRQIKLDCSERESNEEKETEDAFEHTH